MNRLRSIVWGIVLVALGIVIGLNVLGIISFDIFFDGWWTLFIIVPSFVSLITGKEKTIGIIGTVVGVMLLLAYQDVIDKTMIFKLLVPFIIVLAGLKLIFKDFFNREVSEAKKKIKASAVEVKEYAAVFSGQNLDFSGQVFTSAELNAVFGGIKCDLRNAIITDGAVINICSVFGGVDVFLPQNVNVKISSSSIFGGMSDKRQIKTANGDITVYITGNCIFGGADIK